MQHGWKSKHFDNSSVQLHSDNYCENHKGITGRQSEEGKEGFIIPVNGYSAPPVSGPGAKSDVKTMRFAMTVQIIGFGWERIDGLDVDPKKGSKLNEQLPT